MKRRHFLGLTGLLAIPLSTLANARKLTLSQAEGPFYPVQPIPLATNLVRDAEKLKGETMHLSGRVVDQKGQTLPNIKVEIWQCDGAGLYDHPRQSNAEKFDKHFAGAGAAMTDAQGTYRFQTLYPVPYTGRPPHIHVKLWRGQQELLTTQLYLQGQTGNEWFGGDRSSLQIAPKRDANGNMGAGFEFVV